jgi:nitrate reductase NapE component
LEIFFCNQTDWVLDKESKKTKSVYLYYHLGIHSILAIAFVGELDFIFFGVLLTALHGLIDSAKLKILNTKTKVLIFFADQYMHLIAILAISLWYTKTNIDVN